MDLCRHQETRRERETVLNNSRTRAAKPKAQEEYTAVDREVKRNIKKDKRDYIDDLARQSETSANLKFVKGSPSASIPLEKSAFLKISSITGYT